MTKAKGTNAKADKVEKAIKPTRPPKPAKEDKSEDKGKELSKKKVEEDTPSQAPVDKHEESAAIAPAPAPTSKGTPTEQIIRLRQSTHQDFIVASAYNKEVVLLKGPEGKELSRRVAWRIPVDLLNSMEAGKVYQVSGQLTNKRDMEILISTVEITSVVRVISLE